MEKQLLEQEVIEILQNNKKLLSASKILELSNPKGELHKTSLQSLAHLLKKMAEDRKIGIVKIASGNRYCELSLEEKFVQKQREKENRVNGVIGESVQAEQVLQKTGSLGVGEAHSVDQKSGAVEEKKLHFSMVAILFAFMCLQEFWTFIKMAPMIQNNPLGMFFYLVKVVAWGYGTYALLKEKINKWFIFALLGVVTANIFNSSYVPFLGNKTVTMIINALFALFDYYFIAIVASMLLENGAKIKIVPSDYAPGLLFLFVCLTPLTILFISLAFKEVQFKFSYIVFLGLTFLNLAFYTIDCASLAKKRKTVGKREIISIIVALILLVVSSGWISCEGGGDSSNKGYRCGVCGRSFSAGTTNSKNIIKTGMCVQCEKNYHYAAGLNTIFVHVH